MNILLKSVLFCTLLFASCGDKKHTENTDNQLNEATIRTEIEAIQESDQFISEIDSLTSEIDSLLNEVEQF